MQTKASTVDQTSFLMPTLGEQLDPRQPLKQLADALPWPEFEQAFGKHYSAEGRPAKPVRLMVGLLLLKQMFNQGDETVVAAWVRSVTPSLPRRLLIWVFTVASDTNSRCAISAFERPWATWARTSRSRPVRPTRSGVAGPFPPARR